MVELFVYPGNRLGNQLITRDSNLKTNINGNEPARNMLSYSPLICFNAKPHGLTSDGTNPQ